MDSDAWEIAAYRLTGDTLTKVIRAFVPQVMQHPKVEEARKLEAEIEALSKKDELTAAEAEAHGGAGDAPSGARGRG